MNREELIERYVEYLEQSPAVLSDPRAEAESELSSLLHRPLDTFDPILALRYVTRFDLCDPDAPYETRLAAIDSVRDEVLVRES